MQGGGAAGLAEVAGVGGRLDPRLEAGPDCAYLMLVDGGSTLGVGCPSR